ncbi:MAG: DNA-deoxyinosine glycosylase [Sulfuritalea sp.]|nr:DNA-deoxyinosine glycosylase [Sulfuritalea sp.]
MQGLPPIIGVQARVLILGSFPSAASLAARQYYAHPQNQFWRILGAVLGRPLQEMDYHARVAAAQDAGIAIWDVFASCSRAGSLDAAIRDAEPNPFADLKKCPQGRTALAPALRRVGFNGRMAARRIKEIEVLGYEVSVLPSTSPANAGMRFEEKLERWREFLAG